MVGQKPSGSSRNDGDLHVLIILQKLDRYGSGFFLALSLKDFGYI